MQRTRDPLVWKITNKFLAAKNVNIPAAAGRVHLTCHPPSPGPGTPVGSDQPLAKCRCRNPNLICTICFYMTKIQERDFKNLEIMSGFRHWHLASSRSLPTGVPGPGLHPPLTPKIPKPTSLRITLISSRRGLWVQPRWSGHPSATP